VQTQHRADFWTMCLGERQAYCFLVIGEMVNRRKFSGNGSGLRKSASPQNSLHWYWVCSKTKAVSGRSSKSQCGHDVVRSYSRAHQRPNRPERGLERDLHARIEIVPERSGSLKTLHPANFDH